MKLIQLKTPMTNSLIGIILFVRLNRIVNHIRFLCIDLIWVYMVNDKFNDLYAKLRALSGVVVDLKPDILLREPMEATLKNTNYEG